jgi:hypothetical protein
MRVTAREATSVPRPVTCLRVRRLRTPRIFDTARRGRHEELDAAILFAPVGELVPRAPRRGRDIESAVRARQEIDSP